MARRSSETVLQLGSKTLAGLELALTKEERELGCHTSNQQERVMSMCGV
jgi:hypothetical protein